MKNVIFADMGRKFLLVIAFAAASLAGSAQDRQPPWLVRTGKTLLQWVAAPSKRLDTAFVYQSPLRWEAAVEGKTIGLRADLHSDIHITDLTEDKPEILEGTMDTGLMNEPYWKAGLAVGYGALRLGYGVDLAKKKGSRNKYFSLGTNGSFYGAEIQYYKIHRCPTGTLSIDNHPTLDLTSNYPGQMRNLAIDGFYAFDRQHFVYNATYRGRKLQRRSAGSWMVSAKYLQGDFSLDGNDPIWEGLAGLQRYSTQQVSVGGGYSFNWVFLHRDPADPKTEAGLRNLTVNATALPMLSFYNHIQTQQETEGGKVTVRYKGMPTFSPALRGALCYTGGRVRALVSANYDLFGFHSVETEVSGQQGRLRTKVKTSGVFSDLTVAAKVNVRF